jgi:hypothetical protein
MIELPNASFQSQTKAGIAVDFDMLAFLGLTYGVMTLGPKDAFTDGLKAIFGL